MNPVVSSHRGWIEILTPKQVLFFRPLIETLRAGGFEILATSRRYREVEQLSKMHGVDLTYVGERGGKDPKDQLAASIERERQLLPIIEEFAPDFSVSVASADCARISFGLSVPHYAVNDSPHSAIAGKLSLPLTRHLFTPWVIPHRAWAPFAIKRKQITRYRALDPAAWLKRIKMSSQPSSREKTIIVRLEESYAPYMKGKDLGWVDSILRRIAKDFPDSKRIALCRYDDQLQHVKDMFGASFEVPEEAVDGTSLLGRASVFIGLGGTMTAEAALMGVPTISAFQGNLYTEKYLISVGLLKKARTENAMAKLARSFLKPGVGKVFARRASRVLTSMEDPIEIIARFLNTEHGHT
ncbi:MAG: DUF354 domain-containing protein [Thaumarchaeota archaeon]|nr:DUF354 domain-containing protein [Nitrososphaerota archaeon]